MIFCENRILFTIFREKFTIIIVIIFTKLQVRLRLCPSLATTTKKKRKKIPHNQHSKNRA